MNISLTTAIALSSLYLWRGGCVGKEISALDFVWKFENTIFLFKSDNLYKIYLFV